MPRINHEEEPFLVYASSSIHPAYGLGLFHQPDAVKAGGIRVTCYRCARWLFGGANRSSRLLTQNEAHKRWHSSFAFPIFAASKDFVATTNGSAQFIVC